MDTTTNNEPKDLIPEDLAKEPKKKPNVALNVFLGIFFIGYGIFRLTSTLPGDGSWNTFFGWTMIVLGAIRIISLAFIK